MRQQLTAYLDNVTTLLLFAVAGITPLLFLNKTTEFFEMPKLIFIIVMTLLLYGLWIFSWILKGKMTITKTPLDIPLLLLLAIIVVSTFFSTTRYTAIYGNFPRIHESAISWITYILLYFVTVSQLKSPARIKGFLYVLCGSAAVAAVITLLSFFQLYLPFDFAKSVNFTPTGSSFSTIAALLLLLPFALLSIVNGNKYLPLPASILLAALFGITIVLIGSLPVYVILLAEVLLCLMVSKPILAKRTKLIPLLIIPLVIVGFVLFLAYLPGNKLQQMENAFPKEVQLPLTASWKVSVSAFRDSPFIGTGPSSYLFNFTTYKPLEYNGLSFWNYSFDSAYDEFLQILGTIGILGLILFLVVCTVVIIQSWKNLSFKASESHQDKAHDLLPALAVSSITAVLLLLIHATTLVSFVMTLFIFAALLVSQKSIRENIMEFSMGLKASTTDNKQFDLFPIIIFIIFLIAAAPILYFGFKVVAADYYHRQAIVQVSQNGSLTYSYLQKAESLNPYIDLYRVDMAQTNFALANALATKALTSKGKTPLTDQEKQTIQTLLSQAITEGRASVTINARSSRNWEVMASIYRNISGVAQNALAYALDAYGRAIQRDPYNPVLRLNVGGIYYAAKNYDLAIRFFSDAVNLKPDYANAYYNLSIAYKDKGDLQSALIIANQTVALLKSNPESSDYKAASAFLGDLNKLAQNGGSAQNQGAPAGQTNSVLGSKDSNVKVNDLNNPPKVATPEAVKTNPKAVLPQKTAATTRPAVRTTSKTR